MKTAYGAVSFSCWALLLMALMSSLTIGAHGADVAASNKDYSYMDSSSVVERNLAPLVPALGEYDDMYPENGGRTNMNTVTFSAKVSSWQTFQTEPWYSDIPVTAVQIFYTLPGQTKAKKAKLKLGADGVWSIEIKKLPVGDISWSLVATNKLKQTLAPSETYTLTIVAGPPAGTGINCANPIEIDLYDVNYGDDRYNYLFSLKDAVSTCQFGCDCADLSTPGAWTPGFWFKVNHNNFGGELYFDMYVRVTSGPGVASITRFQGDSCEALALCESATQPDCFCDGQDIFDVDYLTPGPLHTCLDFPTWDGNGDPTSPSYNENQYFFVHAYGADSTTKLTVTASLNF